MGLYLANQADNLPKKTLNESIEFLNKE